MISQTIFPPDIRLEKEIKSLSQAGYSVTVLCNQFEKEKAPVYSFCSIIRIKALFNSSRLNKLLNFPLFVNPRYIYYALKAYRQSKPDVIHAHDLPMVPVAFILKWFFNKPVVYDMHENYPAALKYFNLKGLVNKFLRNPRFAEVIDGICMGKADRIITVVSENTERLVNEGINPGKVFTVSNTVDLETFANQEPNLEIVNNYSGRFVLLYTGTVSAERGLETLVRSIKYLRDRVPQVLLLIIGDGPSVKPLKQIIEEEGTSDHITLLSWCGHENLVSYIAAAGACIIPQPNNDFINTTIPHKLFEYMSQSKAVIVSDAIPLKRIVEETNCGLAFESNNPKSFSTRAEELYKNSKNYGVNGRSAVENKYNWGLDSAELLKMYEGLNKSLKTYSSPKG